jgi:hypothetical protein
MPGGGKYSFYSDTLPVSKLGLEGAKGVSNKSLLKSLFSSPDGLDMAGVQTTANKFLVPDVQPINPDPSIFTDEDMKLGFGNAPDMPKDVSIKNVGDPANAYFPNLASPGEGVTVPVTPTNSDPAVINPRAVPGVDGLVNPADTSKQMSNATKIGTKLTPGRRPGAVDKA